MFYKFQFRRMNRPFVALLVLWLIGILSYGYIHQRQYNNPMALSRLDLLHSIVLNGTVAIDLYENNTPDKSFAKGHYYCDKAPGTAALAFPGFYVAAKLLPLFGISVDSERGWMLSSWFCTLTSVGLITATGNVCLFLWLRKFSADRPALVATLAVIFGSMEFPYATMLMSHALVIGLISIALYFLQIGLGPPARQIAPRSGRAIIKDLAAGVAGGLAVASEYSSALVVFGILVAVCGDSGKRAVIFALGAIPPLLLIPIYNFVCDGNPISLPYSHEAVFVENHVGFYGIHFPNIFNLTELLIGVNQGIFYWTPFFFLAYYGYMVLFCKSRLAFWLCYAIPVIHVIVISGYYTIAAGGMLGPRLLAPIVPLLALAASVGAMRLPRLALILALLSILLVSMATVVDAHLPIDYGGRFVVSYYIHQIYSGNVTHNLGMAFGLKGCLSIVPFLVVISMGVSYLWVVSGFSCDESTGATTGCTIFKEDLC